MSKERHAEWYWEAAHDELVSREMATAADGCFVVYHTGDLENHTLAYKVNGEVKYVPIYYRDQLFGFTEPLGFESLLDVINAHNDSPTETENTLQRPLPRPVVGRRAIHSIYRQSKLLRPDADPRDLLKQLRQLSRLMVAREDELEQIVSCTEKLEHRIEEQGRSIEAYGTVIRILETQREKSVRLSASSKESLQAFHKNHTILDQRLTSLQSERDAVAEERRLTEEEKNAQTREYSRCFTAVQDLEAEIEQKKQSLIEIALYENCVDKFKLFIDRLLFDDPREHPDTLPQHIDKSDAKKLLSHEEEGAFIVRKKSKSDKPYAISLCYSDGLDTNVEQFQVVQMDGCLGFEKNTCIFEDIHDLVVSYARIPFCVHNPECGDTTLTYQVFPPAKK